MPWRRAWQPTPVFLPEKSHRQRSLAGSSPQGCRVRHDWSDWTHTHTKKLLTSLGGPPSEPGLCQGISSSSEHFLQLHEPLKRFFLTQGPWFPFSMSTSFRIFIFVNFFSAPLRCKPFSNPLASFYNLGLSFSRTWETFSWNAITKKIAPPLPVSVGGRRLTSVDTMLQVVKYTACHRDVRSLVANQTQMVCDHPAKSFILFH